MFMVMQVDFCRKQCFPVWYGFCLAQPHIRLNCTILTATGKNKVISLIAHQKFVCLKPGTQQKQICLSTKKN